MNNNIRKTFEKYEAKLGALISDGKVNVLFEDNDRTTLEFPCIDENLENFRQSLINIRDNGIYDLNKISIRSSILERLKRKEAKRKAKKMAMRKTKRKAQTKARRINRKGKV